MNYYRLLDDMDYPNRWHLRKVVGVDGEIFVRPMMLPLVDPRRDQVFDIEIQQEGVPLDYTTTSFRSVPVVSYQMLEALSGLEGFTAFAAKIAHFKQATSFHIIHFWQEADCVDEDKSSFEKFQVGGGVRPDLAGRYAAFTKLVIDPSRVKGLDMFRIARSVNEVIVSQRLKDRVEEASISGVKFLPVLQ